METSKMGCVIYSRRGIDTDRNSFDAQLDICRKYCAEHGFIIKKEFSDFGKFLDFGEICLLFEYLKDNFDVSLVMVTTEDRILNSTNPTKLYQYINDLIKVERQINLITITENQNQISFSQLQRSLFSSVTLYEQSKKEEKSYKGLIENALDGNWIGVLPKGYKRVVVTDYNIVHSKEAKFIRKAFEMKLSKISDKEILKYLFENDISIIRSTLHAILKNVFYTGHIRTKLTSGKLVKGRHDGLITQEEFEQVQIFLRNGT
ncbi:MAG: recombinase family protein [Chryseotalea sp. WA131a]|nr:MAG: recombinase family protein [Chryseotalea sp. WA131a]